MSDQQQSETMQEVKKKGGISLGGVMVIVILMSIYTLWFSGVPKEPVRIDPQNMEGATITLTLIEIMDRELRHGWLPNDVGPTNWFLDNRPNHQLGTRFAVFTYAQAMRDHLARARSSTEMNKNLISACERFSIDDTAWMFPSAEGEYREGINYLRAFLENLENGRGGAYFNARSDNIMEFLIAMQSLLGHCNEMLVNTPNDKDVIDLGDGRVRNIKTDWWHVDDDLHYARGIVLTTLAMAHAGETEFDDVLGSNEARSEYRSIVFSLERAASVNPWFTMNSALSGFLANHPSNMSGQLGDAKAKINSLITILDRG